jgi:hypothetical protein
MLKALDEVLNRGYDLRDQMSDHLATPAERAIAGGGAGASGAGLQQTAQPPQPYQSGSLKHAPVPKNTRSVPRTPRLVNEFAGRRDHIGELVKSILPDPQGLPGVQASDLVRVYAVQLVLRELNLSMPSALVSQLQAGVSKNRNGAHAHHQQQHQQQPYSDKWHLCYQLPVTSQIGEIAWDTFSVPVNAGRLFECIGIGSSFNVRLDLEAVKVHPLLFDAAMAQVWAGSNMTFELRLGRKIVCTGAITLKQCITAAAAAAAAAATAASAAASLSPSICLPLAAAAGGGAGGHGDASGAVVAAGTSSSPFAPSPPPAPPSSSPPPPPPYSYSAGGLLAPSLVVPLLEADEMRSQQQPAQYGRPGQTANPRWGRSVGGSGSRKQSQGVIASVSLDVSLLKQHYALPATVRTHADPSLGESRTTATTTATAPGSAKPDVNGTSGAPRANNGAAARPSGSTRRATTSGVGTRAAATTAPLFLQVFVGDVRTLSGEGPHDSQQHVAGQAELWLRTSYRPFTCQHIHPSDSFRFETVADVRCARDNSHAAFRVNDARLHQCGFPPLSHSQRQHLAKNVMIFEFWTSIAEPDPDGGHAGASPPEARFLGLAKVPLKGLYREVKAWRTQQQLGAGAADAPLCVQPSACTHVSASTRFLLYPRCVRPPRSLAKQVSAPLTLQCSTAAAASRVRFPVAVV